MKIQSRSLKSRKSLGFTLLELIIVVVILGFLAAAAMPALFGSSDGAKAQLLSRASQNIATNVSMLSQTCGTTSDVVNSPIPATTGAANFVRLLFGGNSAANNGIATNATYASCYTQARIKPLGEMGQFDTVWKIGNFAVSLSGGGTAQLGVTFSGVPDSIVLIAATSFNSSSTVTTSAGSVAGLLTWTASTTGSRDLTFLRQVN